MNDFFPGCHIRAYLNRAKVKAKAKKDQRKVKTIKEKMANIKEKLYSLGINGPLRGQHTERQASRFYWSFF